MARRRSFWAHDTVSDVSTSIRSTSGKPLRLRFSLGLPGHSRFSGEGDLETGAAAQFDGMIDFESEDFALLSSWAKPDIGGFAANLAGLGEALADRSASLSGHIEASAVGLSGRDVKIALDRSTLNGSFAFTRPVGTDPGRLYVDLSSDLLDVDALPSADAGKALLSDFDLSLSLRAKTLHVAHVNDAEIDGGSLALKVVKSGPNVTLDRLSIANLGGAFLDAQGATGPDGFAASGHLRADRLRDFALLAARLAPGEWSRTMVERAASPLADRARFRGAWPLPRRSRAGPQFAQGERNRRPDAGNSQPRSARQRRPAASAVSLDSPDSGALLRQLGLSGANAESGRGHIALKASGAWDAGYDVEATSVLAGADLSGRGRYLPAAPADGARLFGSIKLKAANVAPLLASLGLQPAAGMIAPVDASADLTLRGDQWTPRGSPRPLRGSGQAAISSISRSQARRLPRPPIQRSDAARGGGAAAAIAPAPSPAEITGDLTLDRLPLGDIFALAIGAPQPARAGARWSDANFAAAPVNPPPIAVKLDVATLDLADGLSSRGFSAMLRLDNGRLDLDDIGMNLAQGEATGR